MEEGTQSVIYDDYKFLTKEDLERLNLTSLIGTNVLRAYMHGFFIDNKKYKKVMLHLTFKNVHYFNSHQSKEECSNSIKALWSCGFLGRIFKILSHDLIQLLCFSNSQIITRVSHSLLLTIVVLRLQNHYVSNKLGSHGPEHSIILFLLMKLQPSGNLIGRYA